MISLIVRKINCHKIELLSVLGKCLAINEYWCMCKLVCSYLFAYSKQCLEVKEKVL